MKRIIAGGTGLIGKALTRRWLDESHEIVIIGRSHHKVKNIFDDSVTSITWEHFDDDPQSVLKDAELIINLCGENISAKSWTKKNKQTFITSRIDSTHKIAIACAHMGDQSPRLFNASAIGIYGLQENNSNYLPPAFDEDTPLATEPSDFLSKIAYAWEQALQPAEIAGVNVVRLRFAVVLDKSDGALPKMALPIKLFVGGQIGSGHQPITWIALDDLCRAIDFLITRTDVTGAINCTAPKAVTQKEFAHSLAKILHRPCWFTMPAWLLKIVFGEMAEAILLNGQHVVPNRLMGLGFNFLYSDLDQALRHIYK